MSSWNRELLITPALSCCFSPAGVCPSVLTVAPGTAAPHGQPKTPLPWVYGAGGARTRGSSPPFSKGRHLPAPGMLLVVSLGVPRLGFRDHPTHVQHLTGALGGWERAPSPWGLGEHRRGSSGSCGVAPLDTRSLSIPDPQRVQPRSSRCPRYRVGVQGVGAHATCARGCAAAEVMGRCFKTSPLRMFWGCWRLSGLPAPTRCHFSPLLKHPSPGLHGAFSPIPKAPVLSPFSSL